MKPLDNNDGALVAVTPESDDGSIARAVPSVPDSGDADVPTPRAQSPRTQSEVAAAVRGASTAAMTGPSRVSRIVLLGTGGEEADEVLDAAAGRAAGLSEACDGEVRRDLPDARTPDARALRAAAHIAEFSATRMGTGLGLDDEDEATTVDAGAALSDDDREGLARRINSAMAETLPHGTPPPEPVQPLEDAEAVRDRPRPFKQTMLLGLPKLGTPVPPAPAPAAEPALMASVVRVVGPPTQPPPRRSRRVPGFAAAAPSEPDHPDHEAFVLTHPIVAPERPKRPAAVPPPSKRSVEPPSSPAELAPTNVSNHFAVDVGRSSLPGIMLPPAPEPEDFEPASSPGSALAQPLRATIDPPTSLSRTRPPMSPRYVAPDQEAKDLPAADPFAGFVAPQPSLAQRWLVVVVVALAVVGLCSLAAIALGFLGKTGW